MVDQGVKLKESEKIGQRLRLARELKKSDGDTIYQPLRSGRIWHRVNFLKRSLTGLNSEFSFS